MHNTESLFFRRKDCISLISGVDKVQILDRSISTSLEDLRNNEFRRVLFCNSSGRIDDFAIICSIEDQILMISSKDFCSKTRNKLLDGVAWDEEFEIRDAIAAISRFTVLLTKPVISTVFGIDEIQDNIMKEFGDMLIFGNSIGGLFMLDILCKKDSINTLLEILESSEIKELDEHNWNLTRVKLGVIDMVDARGNLPWEVGLDGLITRGKGCYPGQEIHARMDSRQGKKNKTLVSLIGRKNIDVGKLKIDGFGTINITSSFSENEICYSLGICKDLPQENIELSYDGYSLNIHQL
ncbi:MAG: hypothetical protein CMB61_01405 [Euryarchaeota archaeon]|nr:hypothetical protein [Euryarchaeota archaeon]